jgi:hypothetical protein
MEGASKEIVGVITELLPGFIAAWVFYGFTAHPKREPFDRIVQALIFTVIVKAVVVIVGAVALLLGRVVALGVWNQNTALVWSVIIAVVLGIVVARLANSDCVGWLRRLTKSRRTTFPSEWFSALHRHQRWVVLHLKGERRLRGWPEEWPDACDKGHFLLSSPAAVLETGRRVPLVQVERLLVSAGNETGTRLVLRDASAPRSDSRPSAKPAPTKSFAGSSGSSTAAGVRPRL